MNKDLQALGVNYTTGNDCKCNNKISYTYNLPQSVDLKIIKYLEVLGNSSTSLQKQAILKIDTDEITITAIKRFKNIKLVIKKPEYNYIIDKFEEAILNWLKGT